jgi:hypothetical protein
LVYNLSESFSMLFIQVLYRSKVKTPDICQGFHYWRTSFGITQLP